MLFFGGSIIIGPRCMYHSNSPLSVWHLDLSSPSVESVEGTFTY